MGAAKFEDIGRLPEAGDNVAIAVRQLDAGQPFEFRGRVHELSHSILEGHRFAVEPIQEGTALRSWNLPFGEALRTIHPGEYVCNAGILDALNLRKLGFTLPLQANFRDSVSRYELDEKAFRPGRQVPPHPQQGSFEGFLRSGGRGAGTRNDIVILGTSSLTASFARSLESRLKNEAGKYPNIDGIVAVTHTEGGGIRQPNNLEFVMRTLAGFMVHPNVGAVLAVDHGSEVLNNAMLKQHMDSQGYPVDDVLHRFHSLQGAFETELRKCEEILRGWLSPVNAMSREPRPLSELKIALQCGGSDAFSGVSGNPLAGWAARELIRHGGSATLAETDELIGAEPYVLANTRDYTTAQCFLDKIAEFKERIAWHGFSAEGNTTGGNKYRGLYNNALKSVGAARKKDPDVRLDYVIDYGQRMSGPGFYFMDSPGNDLESIAGQVASGCNMIFFITGNGSITNFPFVPTVKFITTTGRWKLLSADMDINAGRYQDGASMEELGMETFDYTVRVASGMRSAGEHAGHSQVSIWRDWRQTDGLRLKELQQRPRPDGKPIAVPRATAHKARFRALPTERGFAADQLGLILPTSLCSGQIALRIAGEMNAGGWAAGRNVSRFVALPHTEGCGASSGENERIYTRTAISHLVHPCVKAALLLEHGCEHTHNDLMRHVLQSHGVEQDRFGYASVQLDGGIDRVADKVEQWFKEKLPPGQPAAREEVGLKALSLGLTSTRGIAAPASAALAEVTSAVVGSGGTVVVPENASLWQSAAFLERLGLMDVPNPSLDYGQIAGQAGLHVMAAPSGHAVETLSGLGGTGVQLILVHIGGPPLQGHPMIPVLQFATMETGGHEGHGDLDYLVRPGPMSAEQISEDVLQLLCDTASGKYQPRLWVAGNTDFQLTRGLLGVSL